MGFQIIEHRIDEYGLGEARLVLELNPALHFIVFMKAVADLPNAHVPCVPCFLSVLRSNFPLWVVRLQKTFSPQTPFLTSSTASMTLSA